MKAPKSNFPFPAETYQVNSFNIPDPYRPYVQNILDEINPAHFSFSDKLKESRGRLNSILEQIEDPNEVKNLRATFKNLFALFWDISIGQSGNISASLEQAIKLSSQASAQVETLLSETDFSVEEARDFKAKLDENLAQLISSTQLLIGTVRPERLAQVRDDIESAFPELVDVGAAVAAAPAVNPSSRVLVPTGDLSSLRSTGRGFLFSFPLGLAGSALSTAENTLNQFAGFPVIGPALQPAITGLALGSGILNGFSNAFASFPFLG